MKKIILLPLILLAITGCTSKGSTICSCQSTSGTKETVTLSKDNFSKFVATQSTCTYHSSNDYANYYTYFIGAANCKFIDCTVSYTYTYQGEESSATSGTTIPLTISGDGEAKPFVARTSQNSGFYALVVIAASGTVEYFK